MEYKPEEIPEEMLEEFLVSPPLEKHTIRLKSKLSKSFKEIDFLPDTSFSFNSSLFYKEQFLVMYQWTNEELKKIKLNFENNNGYVKNKDSELILGIGTPPIHLLIYLDGFIMSTKRTIDFLIKLMTKELLKYKYKKFSLDKFANTLKDGTSKYDNINLQLLNNHPKFRTKFIQEWDLWIQKLREHRARITHNDVLKDIFFDTRFFKSNERESEYVKMVSKKVESPLEFINDCYTYLLNFTLWCFNYLINRNEI